MKAPVADCSELIKVDSSHEMTTRRKNEPQQAARPPGPPPSYAQASQQFHHNQKHNLHHNQHQPPPHHLHHSSGPPRAQQPWNGPGGSGMHQANHNQLFGQSNQGPPPFMPNGLNNHNNMYGQQAPNPYGGPPGPGFSQHQQPPTNGMPPDSFNQSNQAYHNNQQYPSNSHHPPNMNQPYLPPNAMHNANQNQSNRPPMNNNLPRRPGPPGLSGGVPNGPAASRHAPPPAFGLRPGTTSSTIPAPGFKLAGPAAGGATRPPTGPSAMSGTQAPWASGGGGRSQSLGGQGLKRPGQHGPGGEQKRHKGGLDRDAGARSTGDALPY